MYLEIERTHHGRIKFNWTTIDYLFIFLYRFITLYLERRATKRFRGRNYRGNDLNTSEVANIGKLEHIREKGDYHGENLYLN